MTIHTGSAPRSAATPSPVRPDPERIARALDRRSFCTLATTSAANRPHVAGVLYERVDGHLYVSTLRHSRKARNISETSEVAVCVPVRRLPFGPPSTVHFQGVAEVLSPDAQAITALLGRRQLRSISGHGELDLPGACVLRITPGRRLATYGLGLPLRRLVRDPLHAAGTVDLESASNGRPSPTASPRPSGGSWSPRTSPTSPIWSAGA